MVNEDLRRQLWDPENSGKELGDNLLIAKERRTGLNFRCMVLGNGEARVIDELGNARQFEATEFEAKYELVN